MLADLIREHAQDLVDEGDFGEVAKRLSAKTIPVKVGKVGGKATLSALVANGINPNVVIAAMRSVPMASELLDTLTVSGVDWDDEMTKYVMGGLVQAGKITQQVAAIVQGLSMHRVSLAGRDVTPAECEAAWQNQQSLDYLSAKVAERAVGRAAVFTQQTRDAELLKSTRDRIAVAERDGVSLTITTADIDAALEQI